jgi:repressor LexA
MALTKKQKHFYDYICNYIQEHGFAPTQNEIKLHFGFKSLGSVQDYIKYLTNAGYLKNDPNAVRGLEPSFLPEQKEQGIPLLGRIAAGHPIEAIEHQQFLDLPIKNNDEQLFALEVAGDSMEEAGICDGDTVIIKSQTNCQNGDIVVADIGGEVTLKTIKKAKNECLLIPANKKYQAIKVDPKKLRIKGVLKTLIRNY